MSCLPACLRGHGPPADGLGLVACGIAHPSGSFLDGSATKNSGSDSWCSFIAAAVHSSVRQCETNDTHIFKKKTGWGRPTSRCQALLQKSIRTERRERTSQKSVHVCAERVRLGPRRSAQPCRRFCRTACGPEHGRQRGGLEAEHGAHRAVVRNHPVHVRHVVVGRNCHLPIAECESCAQGHGGPHRKRQRGQLRRGEGSTGVMSAKCRTRHIMRSVQLGARCFWLVS